MFSTLFAKEKEEKKPHPWPPNCRRPSFDRKFEDPDHSEQVIWVKPQLQPGREFDPDHPFLNQHDPDDLPLPQEEKEYPPLCQSYDMYSSRNNDMWVIRTMWERKQQVQRWQELNRKYQETATVDPEFSREGFDYPAAESLCDIYEKMWNFPPRTPAETDPSIRTQMKRIEEANLYLYELQTALTRIHSKATLLGEDEDAIKECRKEIKQVGEDIEKEEIQLRLLRRGGTPNSDPIWTKGKHWTIPGELKRTPAGLIHEIAKYENWVWKEPPPPDKSWLAKTMATTMATVNGGVDKIQSAITSDKSWLAKTMATVNGGVDKIQSAITSDKCVKLFAGSPRKKPVAKTPPALQKPKKTVRFAENS